MPVLPFRGKWPTIAPGVFLAEGALIIGDVTIGEGSSVWFNAVLRGDIAPISIGRHTNIQDNCTLHVDQGAPCVIGDECSLGHGAVLHGATLGDRVLIGIHAVILSRAAIGAESIVGACALVSEGKHLPGGMLYVGVPSKALRALTQAEQADLPARAERYWRVAAEHQAARKQAPEQQ